MTPTQIEERKKAHRWSAEFEYSPTDKYTLKVQGSESRVSRTWEGSQEKLQARLVEIVSGMLELVPLQKEARAQREAAEIEARKRAEAAEIARRKRAAREELFKQAFAVADTNDRVKQLQAFLLELDEQLANFTEPFKSRTQVWIQVIREELEVSSPMLSQLIASVNGPSWRSWPPDWWPTGVPEKPGESDCV